MSSKESLLEWCKRCTKDYPDVEITNYTTSWTNGLAFNALLHSHRPDSFNFNHIISKSPVERLEHAFRIMNSDYYIELNVVPIEIIVKPDRNRIMNILNKLYEALNDDSSDENDNSYKDQCDSEIIVKKYQEDVEDVLTWILGAEEKLNIEQDDNREESLDTIQQIFQSLDDFTTESTDKQKKIEDVLREGQIIMKTILTTKHEKEKKEIQIQRDLLNDKWEELKNLIMDKQERLHNTLMSLQKKQLEDFSNWLRIAETKIASFNEIEEDLEQVKKQYKDHLIFQNEVREHEPMVKRLSSMVIIIDECENPNFSTENLTDDLVDQLEALAEKWKNVCTITEEREITLNIWIMLLEQENEFNNWVMKIVKRIQEIEKAASDGKSKVNFLSNLMNRLDKMKKDVNVQSEIYAEMFKEAQQKLRKLNKDSQSAIRIKHKIETLSKQWNSILERMNVLSNSIKQMYDKQNELTRKGSIRSQRSSSIESQSNKRCKLNKWELDKWQKASIEFLNNLRKHEELFGINLENNDNDKQSNDNGKERLLIDDLDIKEQELLIYEKEDEFIEIELEYQHQINIGQCFIEELENKTNEDTTGFKELLDRMKLRWNNLKDALDEKQLKIDAYTNLVKLHNECDVMVKKLIDNNKRIDTAKLMIKKLNSKQNYKEINDIYSKYNLKNKLTLTQQDRVENIEKEFNSILKKYPKFYLESIRPETNQVSIAKVVKDLKYFLKYWNETNDKINDFQTEVENILKIGKSAKKKEETLNSKYPKLMNAIDLLDKWLIKTYQIVHIAQLNLYWESENYDEQLNSFKELENDIENEKKSLDYINETSDNIIQLNFDIEWTPVFKNRVRDLNEKWNKTIEILKQKIDNLDNLKELVPKLDEKLNEFWKWLESAKEFLDDSIVFDNLKMVEEQIQQYDALIEDINSEVWKSIDIIGEYYKKIKDLIRNSKSNLLTSNLSLNELSKQDDEQQQNKKKSEINNEITKRVKDAIENFRMLQKDAENRRDLLVKFLKECKKIEGMIDNFDRNVHLAEFDYLKTSDIDSLNEFCLDLEAKKENLVKKLNNSIKMKANLEQLITTVLDSYDQFNMAPCLEKIINKIIVIQNHCNSVINDLNRLCADGITIKDKYNELCKMYNNRSSWLDRLEQIISRSTHELVDSEEICDYLENLENHLRNKPENVCLDKVELLLKDLFEFSFNATPYVEKQEDRWFTSTAEAGNRNKQLEQMLIETQEFEKQLIKLEEKLGFIELNLDENINELNSDNEHKKLDVEQLEDKFKEANKLLNNLSEQINKLIAEQRQLAASRFKEQLKYLQINYTELDKRFNELKNLPNINLEKDTLIEDLKKVYDELQNRQLTNSETDLIQKKLFECTQPLGDLDNRITELQKSSLSLEDKQTDRSKSSKASILKSHSDLDLSSPTTALTNGLINQTKNTELMENQDLNISQNDNSQKIEPQNQNNSNHLDNFSSYNDNYDNQQEQIPQAIEINLDNSNYLQEQEELFEESVDWPWERCLTDNYVPYYKNHEYLQCFWNHPNWSGLMDDISELNEIYYAAYRTAIKIRTIQQTLFLNCIHITNMCKIFDTFDFINDNLVSVPEMISIFKRIYEDISAKFTRITNYGLIIDMALNWVLNLYDLDRTGYINLLAFKICLVCLSRASIEEKYKVLYQLSADSKGFADRQSIGNLLKYMLEIPKLLGDVAAFGGSNFEPSIRSCFEQAQDKQQLNVKNFLQWVKKEPQCMVWLPLLHRLIIAEGSRHPNKCSICKAYPICGFRYKCLKCFNCDICQNCFLLCRPLNGHKNTHPIKEYCYTSGSSRKEVSDLSKIVRNKFKSSRKSFRKHFADSYLPVNTNLDNIDSFEETNLSSNKNGVSLLQYSPISTNRDDVHNKMEFYANKLAEAELNETNSFNMNSIELKNLTNNSDNLDNSNLINQSTSNQQLKELNLSKSNNDEHDLIMNYCNILNGGNSSVLSNKFASLNDSLSKFSQTSSTSTQKRKLNGYLSSQDYLNNDLDEHQLIKSYCLVLANSKDQLNEIRNPNQVLTDLSENSKRELSFLINQLEKENYALESNYNELKKQKYGQSPISIDNELMNGVDLKQSREEMLNEQKQLGIISKALEERMKILEQHNQELQIQLSKLKLKLDQDCK